MKDIIDIANEVKLRNGNMYYVGGYVRDKILKRKCEDIDVEVYGIPEKELIDILAKHGDIDYIGSKYGIYKLNNIDFCMPRKEIKTGEGHKNFHVITDHTLSTYEASKRRDFTVNALLEDVLTGEITDHFNGLEHIKNKELHHIDETFKNDGLRVLRACQLASRLDFKISKETINLCKNMNVTNLSKERVFNELKKCLLKSSKPSMFFECAKEIGLLDNVFKPMNKLIELNQNPIHHPEGDVYNHTMLVLDECAKLKHLSNDLITFMLSGICHDLGKITKTTIKNNKIVSYNHEKELHLTEEFLDNIINTKQIENDVKILVSNHMKPNIFVKDNSSDKAVKKLIKDSEGKKVNIKDAILLSKADRLGRGKEEDLNYDKWWNDKLIEFGYDKINYTNKENDNFKNDLKDKVSEKIVVNENIKRKNDEQIEI